MPIDAPQGYPDKDKLFRVRVKHRISASALAKAVGVASCTILSWEAGESKPSEQRYAKWVITLQELTGERLV